MLTRACRRTKAWRGYFEHKSQVSKLTLPGHEFPNPWLAIGQSIKREKFNHEKISGGGTQAKWRVWTRHFFRATQGIF